jgi:hypothetical protein
MGDGFALSLALRAGGPDAKKTLTPTYLAGASAVTASLRRCARFTGRSLALGTGFPFLNVDLCFHAKSRVHETDGEIIPQIGPSAGVGLGATSTPKPEELIEYVSKTRENVIKASESRKTGTLKSVVTILIVDAPFVGIPQYFIGLGRFFELFFCLFVPWIAIWVVFQSQLSILRLDLVVIGVTINAKYFVVIPFRGHDVNVVRQWRCLCSAFAVLDEMPFALPLQLPCLLTAFWQKNIRPVLPMRVRNTRFSML